MKIVYLNTNGDTTTLLPFPLEVGGYVCSILEMNGKVFSSMIISSSRNNNNNNKKKTKKLTKSDQLYLCCDIIEESIIGEIKMPILRYIKRKNGYIDGNIPNTIWLKVQRPIINSIRLYIADEFGKIISLPRNKLYCTLVFSKLY